MAIEKGTKEDPWKLKTPSLSSDYVMYKDEKDGKEVIVCVVGKTTLLYDYRMYVPPLMERLGLAEVTHDARGNKMRAI